MWTSAVFSLTPVKAEALESMSSLMMMVVLMRMNMLHSYASVKANILLYVTHSMERFGFCRQTFII